MTSSHPDPPTDLSSMRLVIKAFTCEWYRIHGAEHDALHFGRQAAHRFDAADGTFGVLYVARDVHGDQQSRGGTLARAPKQIL